MELINQRKEKDLLDKKLKDIVKERDLTMTKLKMLSGEKARICQMFDNKVIRLIKMLFVDIKNDLYFMFFKSVFIFIFLFG